MLLCCYIENYCYFENRIIVIIIMRFIVLRTVKLLVSREGAVTFKVDVLQVATTVVELQQLSWNCKNNAII